MHIGANRGRLRQVLCYQTTKLLRLGKEIIENVIEIISKGVSFETHLTIVRGVIVKRFRCGFSYRFSENEGRRNYNKMRFIAKAGLKFKFRLVSCGVESRGM